MAPRLLLPVLLTCTSLAAPPAWPDAIIRLERQPAGANAPQISAAVCVASGLLATILEKPAATDTFRAGGSAVKLLARDDDSGFALLSVEESTEPPAWTVVPLAEKSPALPAGGSLTLQSAAPAPARIAGQDFLHHGRLLPTPWLRIHLPAGAWSRGTPLTTADGTLAGLLAGGVPDVPEAARILPAAAVRHFVTLWTQHHTLARAELGIRLRHTDAIPRIEECYAALPAERYGIHPGDILLKIADTETPDSVTAAAACFYLRVDEPVKIQVLRDMEIVEVTATPVSATQRQQAARPK